MSKSLKELRKEAAKSALVGLMESGLYQAEVARLLNVRSVDIYHVVKGERPPSAKLWESLVTNGYVGDINKPYPYLKVRRDDATSAAASIVRNIGEDFASELYWQLILQLRDGEVCSLAELQGLRQEIQWVMRSKEREESTGEGPVALSTPMR